MEIFIEYTKGGFTLIGLGVVLHYYAFAIAWGVAKGWAKVTHSIDIKTKHD